MIYLHIIVILKHANCEEVIKSKVNEIFAFFCYANAGKEKDIEMQITKRDGTKETYESNKIARVIKLAFENTQSCIEAEQLKVMLQEIEQQLVENPDDIKVEQIQDLVEVSMMKHGFYKQAKSFILYRDQQAKNRRIVDELAASLPLAGLRPVLKGIHKDYGKALALDLMLAKYQTFYKPEMDMDQRLKSLIRSAVECVSAEAPQWEFIAGRLLNFQNNHMIEERMAALNIHSFYDKLVYLTEQELYGRYILEAYSKQEVDELAAALKEEHTKLFTYSGLDLVIKRYLIADKDHQVLEKPQEMFMGIAMHLNMKETEDRLHKVIELYEVLSTLKVTMATPTMSNSRKPYFQLSSCFIDTVPDSLEGIYRSIDNFAQISKFGGGMGLYFGKVRAVGSDIRGFKGVAGGVARWIKLANDTAVAVDQLGVRQGSVAVYLDVWHKDILDFLQLRTNNGDDRKKAHDVFPAVCYPDLFWKMAREDLNQQWYLMCPHEILMIKGYALEDFYGEEWEKRYFDCIHDERISKQAILLKDLVRLILKSAIETGTPFAFNRDHVNRMNPNKHAGMIYSSNLCSEIAQNMSAIESVSKAIEEIDGETVIVTKTKPGDFVVCNLASLVLGNINVHDQAELRKIIRIIVRALDNVIDLNFYPIPYAKVTNQRYRPIGLGTSGYHHLLAKEGIRWESEEHLQFMDQVYEQINYYAIEASCELAVEKGRYAYFSGSEWDNGNYFTDRGYRDEKWQQLSARVHQSGLRNGYLLAIAPTSSTSIIAGTSAAVDPIMNRFFLEEKKGSIIARVAPDLNMNTWWIYQSAHTINQEWVVRAAGVRQRHIDQSQSLNLYITNDYTFRQVLNLYIKAWENGVKSVYYIRSKSLEVEECEVCAA